MVYFPVRVGYGLAILYLRDGVLDVVAPPREVYEDAAIIGHGDPCRHRTVEGRDYLQLADEVLCCQLLRAANCGKAADENQDQVLGGWRFHGRRLARTDLIVQGEQCSLTCDSD